MDSLTRQPTDDKDDDRLVIPIVTPTTRKRPLSNATRQPGPAIAEPTEQTELAAEPVTVQPTMHAHY